MFATVQERTKSEHGDMEDAKTMRDVHQQLNQLGPHGCRMSSDLLGIQEPIENRKENAPGEHMPKNHIIYIPNYKDM